MKLANPFNSQDALTHSNYHKLAYTNHKTTSTETLSGKTHTIPVIAQQLGTFIVGDKHPCIIARSAMRANSCRFGVYDLLGSKAATAGLSRDLITFMHERPQISHPYASFMAVFQKPLLMQERTFENKLWKQLQLLQEASARFYPWDTATSHDPADNNFGFSFGGKAFYVVGMHANSSRKARQFPYPMLVFNLHEQFETLRDDGSYDKIKTVVRKNDIALQGSVNPMLQDFGKSSEAKQYSGRAVPENWKCPYLASISSKS